MSGFLDELMQQEKSIISSDFFKTPTEIDFFEDNFNIAFDSSKKASYLFYVESPFELVPGFYPNVNAFVLKATPYVKGKSSDEKRVADNYDNNYTDGDTMHFEIDSIQDGDSGFAIGQKTYQSFKDFLTQNQQDFLALRLIGMDAPEIPHYQVLSYTEEMYKKNVVVITFEEADRMRTGYKLESRFKKDGTLRDKDESITFIKGVGNKGDIYLEQIYCQKDSASDNLRVKVVSKNDHYDKTLEYVNEGFAAANMLRTLLEGATDIRLVLDYQSLNKKPKDISSPYDVFNYVDENGFLNEVGRFLKEMWDDEMGEKGYYYRGFNLPGQDTYGRQLGALYVKMPVSQLGKEEVWVNAAKYILYHYDKFTKAIPEYGNSVTHTQFNNFFSPVFKLYSYDKATIEAIDQLISTTDDMMIQRNQLYEYLYGEKIDRIKEQTVILGDIVLFIPPSHIRAASQTSHQRVPLLRGKGSAVRSLPNSRKVIELDVYFNDEEGINGKPVSMKLPTGETVVYYMNGLRSLLALFKLTPFLPIENHYINDAFNITAVSLINISVETMPNYPRCLKATLTLADFNYSIFMPELPESEEYNTFARTIHYPAMRWYYQKPLLKGNQLKSYSFQSEEYIKNSYGSNTAFLPMDFKDSSVQFYIPDPLQLLRRLEIINEKEPVFTKEQMTDNMKKGFEGLRTLRACMLAVFDESSLQQEVGSLLQKESTTFSQSVFASLDKNEPPVDIAPGLPVPLFAVAEISSHEEQYTTRNRIYPFDVSGTSILKKEALRYTQDSGTLKSKVQALMGPDYGDDGELTQEISREHVRKIGDCFKEVFSDFGTIEIEEIVEYERKEGNEYAKLYWDVFVPLPMELRQSNYEIESLTRRVLTDLGLPANTKPFRFNNAGMLCMPLRYCFSLKNISTGDVGASLFEPSSQNFTYDTNAVSEKVLNYILSMLDINGDFVGNADENSFMENLKEKRDIVENESNVLKFIPYDVGSLIVERMSINYSNTFSNMSLKMLDGVAFQYCGGQDMALQLTILTDDITTVEALMHLPELSAYHARQYRRVLNCWPLRIKSELSQLFGIHEVLIENVQTETIPNQPGVTRIVMTLFSVDRTVRRKEGLQKLDAGNNSGSLIDGNKTKVAIDSYFDLNTALGKVELYPDLELPTIEELEKAGFKIYSQTQVHDKTRTYVDPDFYFAYGHALGHEIFRKNFYEAFDNLNMSYNLSDKQGALTSYLMFKDPKQNRLELKNEIAKIQKAELGSGDIPEFTYADLTSEIYNSLSQGKRVEYRLAETMAQLSTPFWHFTDEAKLPLREPEYNLLPESTIKAVEERKQKILDAIDNLMAYNIEHYIDVSRWAPQDGKIDNFEEVIQWTENSVTAAMIELSQNADFKTIFTLFDNTTEQNSVGSSMDKNAIKPWFEYLGDIALAFADCYSGEAFYDNQTIVLEKDEKPKYDWKARMFCNYGPDLFDIDGQLKTEAVFPYAKVQKSNYDEGSFATSIDEAMSKGISFGPFNIKYYDGASLTDFTRFKVKPGSFYFLDDYYIQSALAGNKKTVETHKYNLLTNPGYCLIAFIRQLLMLYRYYVKHDVLVSVYELVRQEASNMSSEEYPELIDENEITKKETLIFAPFLNLLVLVTLCHTPDIKERQVIFEEKLRFDPTHPVSKAYLYDEPNAITQSANVLLDKFDPLGYFKELYSDLKETDLKGVLLGALNLDFVEDISDMAEAGKDIAMAWDAGMAKKAQKTYDETDGTVFDKYEAVYQEQLEEIQALKGTPEYEANLPKASRLKKLISICENYKTIEPHVFANEVYNMMNFYSLDTSLSKEVLEVTKDSLLKDEEKMIKGRMLGLCFALLNKDIHYYLMNKDVASLNQILQTSYRPSVVHENSVLRKFIYALDGRKVILVAKMGNSDMTFEAIARNLIYERVCIEKSENPKEYLRDSFLDMLKYDKRGRMLRAFPTYYLLFIDEGRELGLWKLHDNFYGSNAVAEIEIAKSRKIATDTAHIVLTNLFNSYSADDTELVDDLDTSEFSTIRYKVLSAFESLFSPRSYFINEELKRQNMIEPNQAIIMPGARMHVRMGYGANAAHLPIVFNGQVAEITTGEVVELVAQGDGAELLNPIQDHDDAADSGNENKFFLSRVFDNWLTQGATPRTILASLLVTEGTWLRQKIKKITNNYYYNTHPYGVNHFGDIKFKDIFHNGEPVQNIFEVYSRAPYETGEVFNIGLEAFYRSQEIPKISMHIMNKTIWDVMHVCASTAPDYMCSIVPFGLRSSVFLGSGRHYYAYEYVKCALDSGNDYIAEKRKPFEQCHYYHSYSDIIQNNIKASAAMVKTNAVGLYDETGWFGKSKLKQTPVLYVDFDIYPEFQKSMTVDTQLWAQGLPIVGNMFGFFADTGKEVDGPLPGAKEIAWRMTASALKESVKDMYDGDLIVMGDPSVKPYDRMIIQDLYEDMQGPAHVEAVVHSFNAESGFTTSLFADCINVVDDRYEKENDMLIRTAVLPAAAAFTSSAVVNQLFFRKNVKVLSDMFSKAIITGGSLLSKTKLINNMNLLYKSLGLELGAHDTDILLNAIKIANASAPLDLLSPVGRFSDYVKSGDILVDFGVADEKIVQYMFNDTSITLPEFKKMYPQVAIRPEDVTTYYERTYKKSVRDAVNSVIFGGTKGENFLSVILTPFEAFDVNFKEINGAKTALDIAKMYQSNAKALKEVDGSSLNKILNELGPDAIKDKDGKLITLQANVIDYTAELNKIIENTYILDDGFLSYLDALADYIDKLPDTAENVKKQAFILKSFATKERVISKVDDIDEFAKAMASCIKSCNDKDILTNILSSRYNITMMGNIKDAVRNFKKIDGLKDAVMMIGAVTGPIGLAAFVLLQVAEVAITTIIGAYATEWVERYLQNLQVIQIFPLSKNGKVMVAGISGHKGMVVGSPTEEIQGEWTQFVTSLFQTKKPNGLIETLFQYLFVTDRMREIADKYKTQNDMPLPTSSNFDEAKMKDEFYNQLDSRVAQMALKDESYLLQLSRYDSMEKSVQKMSSYLARTANETRTSLDKTTAEQFLPIDTNQTLSKYMELGVLSLFQRQIADGVFSQKVNGTVVNYPYYKDGDKYNVPILRPEMIMILNKLIEIYVIRTGMNYVQDDLEKKIQEGQLVLTSATILNSDTYSGTGYAFSITTTSLYAGFLNESIQELEKVFNERTKRLSVWGQPKNDPTEWTIALHIPKKETSEFAIQKQSSNNPTESNQ